MSARRTRSGGAAGEAPGGRRVIRRLLLLAGVLAVGSFAIQGGEYGSTDLWRQRGDLARERAAVDSLQGVVDSLKAYRRLVESDPVTQERIAREEFGMVKPGEVLYRFADP